jgi:hypothetical protein
MDLSLLERVIPIEWDNVLLYGQYILTGCSSAGAAPQKGPLLAYKITESAYTLFRRNEAENTTSFRIPHLNGIRVTLLRS